MKAFYSFLTTLLITILVGGGIYLLVAHTGIFFACLGILVGIGVFCTIWHAIHKEMFK